jgi:hypothetical protein
MEHELNDNIGLNSDNAVNHIDEGAFLRCTEPGCDAQRLYATLSALRYTRGPCFSTKEYS